MVSISEPRLLTVLLRQKYQSYLGGRFKQGGRELVEFLPVLVVGLQCVVESKHVGLMARFNVKRY